MIGIKKIIISILICFILIGVSAGATNTVIHTYTDYSDLVQGSKEGFTTSSGGTVTNTSPFSYYGGMYHIVPNATLANVSVSVYQGKLDWGVSDTNDSVYLNSTDFRHYAGGSNVNALRFRFEEVTTTAGTGTELNDIWRTSVSSKNNDAILYGLPRFYNTFGTAENCYIKFDGSDDYARIALDSSKNIKTSDFDITFMVMPQNLVDTSQIPVRLGNVSSNDKIDIYQNAGKIGIAYQTATGSHTISVNSTASFTGAVWKHVRLTGHNGVLNLYVNGVFKQTVTIPSSIVVDRLYLGGGNLGTNAWQGYVDEFRLFSIL